MKLWHVMVVAGIGVTGTLGFFYYRANRLPEISIVEKALPGAEVAVNEVEMYPFTIGSPPYKKNMLVFRKVLFIKSDLKDTVEVVDKAIAGSRWKKYPTVNSFTLKKTGARIYYPRYYSFSIIHPSGMEESGEIHIDPGRYKIVTGHEMPELTETEYTTVSIYISGIEPDIIDNVTNIFH